MLIGGKEYTVGQKIRVINAKSVLHYYYGMTGNKNEDMTGITGIITEQSTYNEYARANLKVDKPYSEKYKNGMTRLFCDDEIELIRIITLPIIGKWFYMILSGEKGEEYREIKPYYTSRFKKIFEMYPYSNIPSGADKREIRFRNGYGSSRPEFIALCTLDIKTGREEWGAEPGKEYYTLKIHEITERRGC